MSYPDVMLCNYCQDGREGINLRHFYWTMYLVCVCGATVHMSICVYHAIVDLVSSVLFTVV